MLVLNKKFYSRKKDLEKQGENIFSKASKNISTIAPIIFSLILGPTVVVSSVMSQATFLMIANILLSIGLSLAFLNRVYHGNAKSLEIVLTLGMIAALFFLVLYLSPVITAWNVLGVISFINLFASSINAFFLLRTTILPPVLASIKFVLSKAGFKVDINLDKNRDFEVEIDFEKGLKSDAAATVLLTKNYPPCVATAENIVNNNWRTIAISPYNHSKDRLYHYATRYRSTPFGEINNREAIADCLKHVDNMMLKGSIDGSHNVFFFKKLIAKSEKVKAMSDDLTILNQHSQCSSDWTEKTSFINKRFILHSSAFKISQCIDVLNANIQTQLGKIKILLQCYPLHVAIDYLDKHLNKFLSAAQSAELKKRIATGEMQRLYPPGELQRMGLG